MRKLWILLGLLFSLHAGAESFSEWRTNTWNEAERAPTLKTYKSRIATEGLKAVYADLQDQVVGIPAVTDEELHWKRSFSCAMTANLSPEVTATAIDGALRLSPEDELSNASRERLKQAAQNDLSLRGDPFRPDDPGLRPEYRLLNQGHRLIDEQCGNHEIVLNPQSTSVTAKGLYRISDILTTSLQNTRLPLMEATGAVIHESRARWDAFFTNAMLDQYPWETYVNEWGRHWLSPLRGTLSQPPAAQIRVAHPTAVVVVDDSDGTAFEPSLGIEALGWRAYDEKSYEPRWGVSLLAVLKTESRDSTGYGLLLVAKSFSFGAIVRDTENNSNDVQLVLGVDIAKLFRNKSSASAARASELEKTWQVILKCAPDSFETCTSP